MVVPDRRVVGGGEEPLRRVLDVRHLVERNQVGVPTARRVPPGHRDRTVAFFSLRRLTDQLPANIPAGIRVGEVERQGGPLLEATPQLVTGANPRRCQKTADRPRVEVHGPQRKGWPVAAQRRRHHRAARRLQHRLGDALAAFHVNGFFMNATFDKFIPLLYAAAVRAEPFENRSELSTRPAVTPQATWPLNPAANPGLPANVAPAIAQSGVRMWARYHWIGGRERCGSLQTIGRPVAVRAGPIAQLFDPPPAG